MKSYVQYFLVILFFFPLWISAQVFPVQANPQMIPPYSLKLSEYGTANSEKLILNLLLTDITEANRQVQLKLFIENNAGLSIRSSEIVMGANPIFLDGGVPLRLSNLDLQPYFSLQNLTGIAPQQYSTPLPEGLYRFCFEVYDALSGQQISRKSCVPVYLVLNDPPFLNLPFRGEQVLMREPQNIVFQWTPRHLNATNVSYEFTLTELWDNQMDPQAAFLAGRPLYQTTTFTTTLLYGPGETQLLPDKKYGWRVRAMVSDGISETSVFKNDGYSEIYYYTYTGSCAEPEAILAEAKNNTTEKIYWQGVNHKLFDVQYRKKASDGGIWFNASTLNENTTIYNLEPGTTYEFRVGGQCIEDGPFTYSQIYEFTTTLSTDSDTTYNCGITPEIVITNQELLQSLVINETFTAGDFPVTVKDVTGGNAVYEMSTPPDSEAEEDEETPVLQDDNAQGGGTFSGWGYIVVPYLNDTRIKVSFENIKINTDYQLIEGIVETDYDKNWGGLASVNEVLDVFEGDNDLRNINLDYDITIDNISIADDGSIVITHPVSESTIEYPGGDDVVIMDTNPDGSRDIFHVDADGNIREGGQMAQGGPINPQSTAGVDSNGEVTQLTAEGIKVEFLEYTDYAYGFDRIPSGQEAILSKYYKQIKDAQGNPYNIINKSVGNGDTDIIRARVTISNADLSISDLVIKTIHGEKVDYEISGDGIILLKLKGYYTFEHENIYATIQPKDSNNDMQTIAGVFSQWHLANKDVNVTIVPVNGAELPNASVLGSQINNIFKQAAVTFNVNIAGSINIDKTKFGVGESGNLSNYTSDQKTLINLFKASRPIDRKSYYVFVFGNDIRPSRASVAGFMPLKRQFGFVFSGNLSQKEEGKSSLAGTLAHELGHGAFALQHPFKKLSTTQSGTDWLMDYGNEMRLSHIDWSQIHNPEFRLYLFQDEEDAALTVSMLAPNGYPITYEGEGGIVFTEEIPAYSNGAAFAIFENDRLYEWDANKGDYFFEGTRNPNVFEASTGAAIQLYWHKGSCENNEIYQTTFENIRQNYLINNQIQLNLNVSKDNLPQGISYVGKAGCTDEDCGNIAIPEVFLLQNLAKEITISNDMQLASTPDIIAHINNLNQCALKGLTYEEVSKLLTTTMLQSDFGTPQQTERAIVKLLQLVPSNQEEALTEQLFSINQGLPISNAIAKTTNQGFPEISENKDSVFIYRLSEIIFSLSKAEKWKVFNLIIKYKFNQLEGIVLEALHNILISIDGITDNQKAQISSVLNLFVDMLRDQNITSVINDFKLVYDIALLRNDNRELFRSFTIADFLILVKNPNNNYANMEPTSSFPISTENYSWLLPSLDGVEKEEPLITLQLREGDYIIEDNYLQKNSAWYRFIRVDSLGENALTTNPEDFLKTFLEQFSYYLRIGRESNSEFWNRIVTVNCSNVNEVIKHINLNENSQSLRTVNQNTRFSFLKSYFNQECRNPLNTEDVDYDSHNLEGADNSLMKILSSFSPEDRAILDELEDEIGFESIKNKLSTKKFNEFVVWVSMQIRTSGKVQVPIRPYGLALDDPSTLFQLEANIFQLQNFSGDLIGNKIEIQGVKMAYNQLVMVYVRGSFDFLGDRYKQGTVLLIPLIEAYAMSENNQSTVIWNTAFLALDVISVAMPIAGGGIKLFRLAGHTVKKTILASDMVASGASAIVTALNEDAIDPDLRFKIQMASMATSVPTLFTSLPRQELNALKNRIDNDLDDLRSSHAISERSRDLLKASYRTIGEISSTRIPGVPDQLANAFKRDFPELHRADDLNEDFFNGWVKYRTRHPNGTICH